MGWYPRRKCPLGCRRFAHSRGSYLASSPASHASVVCREWNPRATSSGFRLNSKTASTSTAGRGAGGEFEFSLVSLSSSLSRWSKLASDADGIHDGAAASEVSTDMPGSVESPGDSGESPESPWRVSEGGGDSSPSTPVVSTSAPSGRSTMRRGPDRSPDLNPLLNPRRGSARFGFSTTPSGGEGPSGFGAALASFREYLTHWGAA
mmetsp:Transcript_7286/g.29549  ORF Transcript_7286/g.29549 Transcript_7286/m.29549 type:complete len:206 (-) Transcript_7286:272-889(-)